MNTNIVKHCISCREDGHTYDQCKTVPFWGLVTAAFGLPMSNAERKGLEDGIAKTWGIIYLSEQL